ncbi:MAG: hypothetical protein GYB31_18535 [Bacteroidetes bacterium]|nr:hypothetical protein [Bacteroidota bacterium]
MKSNLIPRLLFSLILSVSISFSAKAQMITISGYFNKSNGQPVEGVPVIVNGDQLTLSGVDGFYSFEVPEGGDYLIEPYWNDNVWDGVTTFDLILFIQHLLGVVPFDDPFDYIAADVNMSCSLSALDILGMRKVILGVSPNFPNAPSWRFFEANVPFPDPMNPCGAPNEYINLEDVMADLADVNWTAVKIGNLNL